MNKTNKIGRNDPCPCGSGKKYKKCHGGIYERVRPEVRAVPKFTVKKLAPSEVPPDILNLIKDQKKKSASFTSQFGHVRQPVTAEYQGYRFVAAGSQLFYQPVQ